MTEIMLLIPGYLHTIPLHQDRQCHKAKTGLMPARSRGPLLLPWLIQPALRKSYLSLTREVCRALEAYKIPGRSRCKDVYMCRYAGLGLGRLGRRHSVQSGSCRRAAVAPPRVADQPRTPDRDGGAPSRDGEPPLATQTGIPRERFTARARGRSPRGRPWHRRVVMQGTEAKPAGAP